MCSVGIHGVLLLGAALAAVEQFVFADNGTSDYACSTRDQGLIFDQVERPRDYFSGKTPASDPPLPLVEQEYATGFLPEVVTIYVEVGAIVYNDCPHHFPEDDQVRVRYVIVPARSAYPKEDSGYWSRRRALANNPRGLPLVKSPGARHALHVLGLEIDSTCPDCARSLNAVRGRY
jgi:hypothetical protein